MRFAFLILLSLTPSLLAAPAPARDNRATLEALREVIEATGKIQGDELSRVRLWCGVAELRHQLGDRDGALAAIRSALRIGEKERDPVLGQWRRIAATLGRIGETAALLELARLIPEKGTVFPKPRETILREAATEAALAGQGEAAGRIADTIPDETIRKQQRETVRRLGLAFRINKGTADSFRAVDELSTVTEKIFALAGRLPIDQTDLGPPDGIAFARLRAKDNAGAKEAADKALAMFPDTKKPGSRGHFALVVIRLLARLDDADGARKVLADHLIADLKDIRKASPLVMFALVARGHIAAAEVRAGHDEAALAFLKDYEGKNDQAFLLTFIAPAQALAGRKEAAKANFAKAIELLEADGTGPASTHGIATSQALAGDFDGAIRTAKSGKSVPATWTNIICARAAAGDFDGARKTLNETTDPASESYLNLLRQIARSQARAGQPTAVRTWAGKLEDDRARAYAFFGLAEGLFQEPAKPGEK